MEILGGLRNLTIRAPNHVTLEITREQQIVRFDAAIAAGIVGELEITEISEIAIYNELRSFLGDGEAACLAISSTRRWMIATDEKGRLRQEVIERLGADHLLTTPGALVLAIRLGVITSHEAEEIRTLMAQNRFVMKDVPPFADLLGEG
jgi:predicted nucleic acid-binding protein